MSGETVITVVGNLTADPELRYTQNGVAVANLTIASTPRTFDRTTNDWKDGDALFLRASVWKEFAEQVAGSLTKGMRVIAQGRLRQRSYQDREGAQRTAIELEIDEIGPSLRYATAQVTRVQNGQGGQRQGGQQAPQQQQQPTTQGYGPPQGGAPGYGPPQGGQQPPQQQGYAPPQGQQGPPQQQAPQQQAPQQQQQQQQAPQQGYQQPPQQQAPQPGTQQAAQQGNWPQPGAFGDDTPF